MLFALFNLAVFAIHTLRRVTGLIIRSHVEERTLPLFDVSAIIYLRTAVSRLSRRIVAACLPTRTSSQLDPFLRAYYYWQR